MNLSGLSRGLFTFAAFVLVIAGLRSAGSIIIPFLLACFIALITSPAMIWMKKKGIRPSFAVLIIISTVLCALWLLVQIAGSSITQFAGDSDQYQIRLKQITVGWINWLTEKGIDVNSDTFNSLINPGKAMTYVVNTLTQFLKGMLTNTFMILLTVVFLLLELAGFPNKLQIALGVNHASVPALNRFSESLNRYLAIKSMVSLGTGLCAYILCRFIQLEYAPLWGILAFLLNYVPNIGSIIAAVPPVMLALVQLGTPRAIATGIGYLCINVIIGNLIEPKVMGKGLGLSTLVVWMSLIFWGWVFGPVGMLLSVPLTMIIKIAMESKAETQWIATLLGTDPGESALTDASLSEPSTPSETND
ncbi:AI-2E family transporter [Kiritimatiellota bacterium B12222]|nr:AI-2E family transporter [Kiritimatiellota bacterium B12222]